MSGPEQRSRQRRVWSSGLQEEIDFWDEWLSSDAAEARDCRENRLRAAERTLLDLYTPRIWRDLASWRELVVAAAAEPNETIRVLDVGAGPLTTIGTRLPGWNVEVVAVDALAKHYAELLRRHAIAPPVATIEGEGELLVTSFGTDSFHAAFCMNALDHCYDPIAVVQQMVEVVKPRGLVNILCVRNVAEKERYHGLHQWNFTLRDERAILWNQEVALDLAHEVPGIARLTAWSCEDDLVNFVLEKRA